MELSVCHDACRKWKLINECSCSISGFHLEESSSVTVESTDILSTHTKRSSYRAPMPCERMHVPFHGLQISHSTAKLSSSAILCTIDVHQRQCPRIRWRTAIACCSLLMYTFTWFAGVLPTCGLGGVRSASRRLCNWRLTRDHYHT